MKLILLLMSVPFLLISCITTLAGLDSGDGELPEEAEQEEVAETEFCSSADSNSESERLLRVLDEIIAKKKKNNSEEES